jgi:hypothetical protein
MTDWVCPECGTDYGTLTVQTLPGRAAALPPRWRAALTGIDDDVLRRRPAPTTWSPIEYAGHVRDVTAELTATLASMVAGDELPTSGDPDQQVLERGYATADPAVLLDGIDAETARLVAFLEGLTPETAAVEVEFPWGTRDVLTIASNAVHEQTHHLFDVERILGSAGSSGSGDGPSGA